MKQLKISVFISENGEIAYEVTKSKSLGLLEVIGILHNITEDVNDTVEQKLKVTKE